MIDKSVIARFHEKIHKSQDIPKELNDVSGWQVRVKEQGIDCIYRTIISCIKPEELPHPIYTVVDGVSYCLYNNGVRVYLQMGCGKNHPMNDVIEKKLNQQLRQFVSGLCEHIAADGEQAHRYTYSLYHQTKSSGSSELDRYIQEQLDRHMFRDFCFPVFNEDERFTGSVDLFSKMDPVVFAFKKNGVDMVVVATVEDSQLCFQIKHSNYKTHEKQARMNDLGDIYRHELDRLDWWPDGYGSLHAVFLMPIREQDKDIAADCMRQVFSEIHGLSYAPTQVVTPTGFIETGWMLTVAEKEG